MKQTIMKSVFITPIIKAVITLKLSVQKKRIKKQVKGKIKIHKDKN